MSSIQKTRLLLAFILIPAAVFYFWHLGRPDIITDESSYAVRAIGMVDFDFGIAQPTPWQWVQHVPWWMHLSFHDHPLLVFLLQHYAMRFFGETPFAARLLSVIAGLAAIWLVYLIGKRLYTPSVGLAAAALFAFTVSHVWISRLGLQESVLIALMLLTFWAFLRGFGSPKWLPLAGVFLGLAFLAKYNALILIPIFSTILIAQHRDLIAKRKFYLLLSIVCFLTVASPVIIYNIELYHNFGHFDFQFSQLLHQDVKEWQAHPGQEVLGSYGNRLRTYIPRLVETNSPYFLILAGLGLAAILNQLARRRDLVVNHWPLVIVFLWLVPFIIFIGPAHRFLAMLTPWLAIAAGYAITTFIHSNVLKNIGIKPVAVFATIVIAVALVEATYTANSVIALEPLGRKPWAYSYLHRQAGSWGFNELKDHLDGTLRGKLPEVAITFEFPFARNLLAASVSAGRAAGYKTAPIGIIYNDNINLSAGLWVFLERIVYRGWPVTSAENFRRGGGREFFRQAGIKTIYFVNATPAALQDRPRPDTPDGDILEETLRASGATPTEIKTPNGDIAFRIYTFALNGR